MAISDSLKDSIKTILSKGVKRADVRAMLSQRAGFDPIVQEAVKECCEYMLELQEQAKCVECGEQMSLKRYCEGNTMCYDCEFTFHL